MQDKGKKEKMVPGEMTGKMMPLKERQARESAFAKELDLVKKTKRVTPTKIIGEKETVNYKMAKPFKEMIMKKIAQRKSAKK